MKISREPCLVVLPPGGRCLIARFDTDPTPPTGGVNVPVENILYNDLPADGLMRFEPTQAGYYFIRIRSAQVDCFFDRIIHVEPSSKERMPSDQESAIRAATVRYQRALHANRAAQQAADEVMEFEVWNAATAASDEKLDARDALLALVVEMFGEGA